MPANMLNTKEVAEYLGIHEKQVYALIKENKIPCTRVTGKWIFPKNLIDEWISQSSQLGADIAGKKRKLNSTLFAAGSNDPILDILLNNMKLHSNSFIFSSSIGSSEGLRLLSENTVDIAWCHLFDPVTETYNIHFAETSLQGRKFAVVHLFYREIGFLMSNDVTDILHNFKDLTNKRIRFINRQKGSGTRIFLDYQIGKEKIASHDISGYDNEVFSHFEVGLSILAGEANAGIGTIAASKLLGIKFKPLKKESFDMILDKETFFEKGVQDFIETLNSSDFRKKIEPLGNYDFNESGKILFAS
jgi:putative molybdopterin biosynthesis protein